MFTILFNCFFVPNLGLTVACQPDRKFISHVKEFLKQHTKNVSVCTAEKQEGSCLLVFQRFRQTFKKTFVSATVWSG